MENVINQIIRIEEQAQAINAEAQELKSNLKSNIDKDVEDIRNNITNKVSAKYETIKATEKNYADKKIEQISVSYNKAEKNLDEVYKTRKDEWINTIYNDIIGIV